MSEQFIPSKSDDQTSRLARKLATRLSAGDILLLSGDVGSGKTHFARSLIQSLLLQSEDVPSPTYTLVQTYPSKIGEIWHADLYRLTDVTEVEELGLLQAFDDAICLIEWPDRLGDLIPEQALSIWLQPGDDPDHRLIRLHWSDPRWEAKLKGLQDV